LNELHRRIIVATWSGKQRLEVGTFLSNLVNDSPAQFEAVIQNRELEAQTNGRNATAI
jgi:hypothetical protein